MIENICDLGNCKDTFLSDFDIANHCTIHDANTTLNTARIGDLSILYVNIVSLPCNMNKLQNFLSKFDKKPDVIGLSETKITEKCNQHYHPHLDNYEYISVKSKSHCGSVGVFIREELEFNIRTGLNCSEYKQFEMLWLDVWEKGRIIYKTTMGIICRHGGLTNIPCFTSRMETILSKLNHEKNNNFHIFGDFNINLLKMDESHNISEFVNLLHSLNVINMINKHTRFPIGKQIGNPSLLDHFWTNQPHRLKYINLIVDPISDHRPILFIMNAKKKITKTCNSYYMRDMQNFNLEAFNDSLFEFRQNNINLSEPNQKFVNIQKHILDCINKHAPLRRKTRKEQKFLLRPWIANSISIQISIVNKNNLYSYLQKHDRPDLRTKYNKMKKILKKVIFAAETNYYNYQFEQCQNNSKKTWRLINDITSRKKRDKATIKSLKTASGNVTSDAKAMANALNEYFTNIGPNMSSSLPPTSLSHKHFLKNSAQRNSFYLTPTYPAEIDKVINSFLSKKSAGPDNIPVKFFKLGSPALSTILTEMINECFISGIFPQSLKLARVVPIFKAGPKDLRSNYRPISILSVLSKLFEKLTYNRLIKFIDKNSILHSS